MVLRLKAWESRSLPGLQITTGETDEIPQFTEHAPARVSAGFNTPSPMTRPHADETHVNPLGGGTALWRGVEQPGSSSGS